MLVAAMMLMVCVNVNAQKEKKFNRHLIIGVSPFNTFKSNLEFEDYKDFNVNYRYKSGWNISLGYERQAWIILLAVEGSYGQTKFDKIEINNLPEGISFNPPTINDNIQQANINAMIGFDFVTLFYNSFQLEKEKEAKLGRFQLPIYIGLGYSYTDGGFFNHHSSYNFNSKIRAKYYFTNTVAAFVGWNLVQPFMANDKITLSEPKIKSNNHVSRYVNMGVIINL